MRKKNYFLTIAFLLITIVILGLTLLFKIFAVVPYIDTISERNYDYQSGLPEKTLNSLNEDYNLHTFFGDPYHQYAVYNIHESKVNNGFWDTDQHWEFYGNYQNMFNCINDNYNLTTWKNETTYAQLILVNRENTLRNLKITTTVTDAMQSEVNPGFVSVKANFLGFTYTDNRDIGLNDWQIRPKNQSQRVADSIDKNTKDFLKPEFVQPIWIEITTSDAIDVNQYNVNVMVTYDGQQIPIKNKINVKVKNNLLQKSPTFGVGGAHSPFPSAAYHGAINNSSINIDSQNVNGAFISADAISEPLTFLSDEHKKYLKNELNELKNNGQEYATCNVDQYYTEKQINYYREGVNNGLVNWIETDKHNSNDFNNIDQNKKGTWNFDFTHFNDYFTYVQTLGFNSIMAQSFGLNFNDTDPNAFSSFPHLYNTVDGKQKVVWDKLYYYTVRGKDIKYQFLKALKADIIAHNWEKKIYLSFDELSTNGFDYYQQLLQKVDPYHQVFKIQLYAGWKYTPQWDNQDWINAFYGSVKNKYTVDNLVLEGYIAEGALFSRANGYQEDLTFPELVKQLNKLAAERRGNGLRTEMYTTQYSYPTSDVVFDYGDNMWSPVFSKIMGLDGFQKWAFNYWRNWAGKGEKQYYANPSENNYGPVNQQEKVYGDPMGHNFFLYPRETGNYEVSSSTRWDMMKFGTEQAWKIEELLKNNSNKSIIQSIMNNVSWPLSPNNGRPIWFDKYYKYEQNPDGLKTNNIVISRQMLELVNALNQI